MLIRGLTMFTNVQVMLVYGTIGRRPLKCGGWVGADRGVNSVYRFAKEAVDR